MKNILDIDILELMRALDKPVTAADLAKELNATKSDVNSLLYRMENTRVRKKGYAPPYWSVIPLEELINNSLSNEPATAEEMAEYACYDIDEASEGYLLGESETPRQILKRCFGYNSFRPLQEEIINTALDLKDSLILMPTGGGKSICFQISALVMEGTAIVVSPLISLMKDQVESLIANGISAATINSNKSETANNAVKKRCAQGEIKLLYVSPERLLTELDWLRSNVQVCLFAIDEAHCVSQWGHDFRPEYTQLDVLHDHFPNVPIMALTATADKTVREDIIDKLKLNNVRIFKQSFDRPNLSLDVRTGCLASEKMKVVHEVIKRHPCESGIIYCLSRKTTEKVAKKLQNMNLRAEAYHAGLSAKTRNKVQEDFIQDKIDIIVATIAFGMGIDKSNVRYIIHYNLPKSIENYYQEIGRAGRDGLPAETVLFYNIQDLITLRRFADESGQPELNREKLSRMQEYAEAKICRRRILLNYFGESNDKDCHNCDVCKSTIDHFDGTIIVQKALSAILRTKEMVSMSVLIRVLRGANDADILAKGYQNIKTFGAGKDLSAKEWREYLLQMLQMGFFEINYKEGNRLVVTDYGHRMISNRSTVALVKIQKEDVADKDVSAGKDESKIANVATHYPSVDERLFAALRQFRAEQAEKLGVPPHVVLDDVTLHSLVQQKPTSSIDLVHVSGISLFKRKLYGESLLNIIQPFVDDVAYAASPAESGSHTDYAD